MKNPINYFYNEKGDYTVTLHDEPIAICGSKDDAVKLKNSFSSLTLRIDALKKTLKNSDKEILNPRR